MARTPLFPALGNIAAWALQFSMRTERDYALLYPKSGTVSLSATTTNVVVDSNVSPQSRIVLQPVTSQAAAMSPWISTKAAGSFTVAGAASASCVFDYLILPPPP